MEKPSRIRDKVKVNHCSYVWVVIHDGKIVGVFDNQSMADSWQGDKTKHKLNRGTKQF